MSIEDKTPEPKDKPVEMKCSLDKNGIAICKITKKDYSKLEQENIKAKKMVFDIE